MKELRIAILKTLFYADVFDFPLKKEEAWEYLIGNLKLKTKNEKRQLKIKNLVKTKIIEEKAGFYFLKGRGKIIEIRKKREKESRRKLKIAKKAAQLVKIIPTVKMVAVTGALAMKNSKKKDDIDFLIVSEKSKLWTTRFLVTILIEIFAKRRRPKDKNITDKICLNMFLDEEHLAVPKKEQDLFSAHEVIQLKPLWEKDSIYQKFLIANRWVERFLPNVTKELKAKSEKRKAATKSLKLQSKKLLALSCSFKFCILSFTLFEKILKHFQLFYMRKKRTTEVVSNGIIRFHPQDARNWILKAYKKRLKNYDFF